MNHCLNTTLNFKNGVSSVVKNHYDEGLIPLPCLKT
jgi:hypothetical protein